MKQAEKGMLSAQRNIDLKAGRIGLISDTHGLVRPEALAALRRSELIIHAGDIGAPEVLDALAAAAPVLAIRGNNDRGAWAKKIPDIMDVKIGGITIRVIHDVKDLERASADRFHAVISGHSHKPRTITKDGVLFLNPGSAGPRRFKLPITVGRLRIRHGKVEGEIVELQL